MYIIYKNIYVHLYILLIEISMYIYYNDIIKQRTKAHWQLNRLYTLSNIRYNDCSDKQLHQS